MSLLSQYSHPAGAPKNPFLQCCTHHIISEISCLGRLFRTFEAFEPEHNGHLLLFFEKVPGTPI